MVEKHKAKLLQIQKAKLQDLKSLANAIEKLSVTIEANANEEGHLYGSVGVNEILDSLKQNDVNLTRDNIKLEGVLKELGLYTVNIRLHEDVETSLKVWVVPTVSDDVPTGESTAE